MNLGQQLTQGVLMSDERYIPELFRAQEENLRLNRELRAERDAHHAFRIDVAKREFLKANEHDCDICHVESIINGSNPRVDADHRVIIDFGEDKGQVGTLDEAGQFWRSHPEQWGNIVGIQKPKEPTAQDLHNAKITGMPMDKYIKGRKPDGSHLRPPETPPAQQ